MEANKIPICCSDCSLDDFNDPSFRTEVSLTIEFQVLSELDDDDEPDTRLSYFAESDDDTCQMEVDSPSCQNEEWWVRIEMQDEDSGLNRIEVLGKGPNANAYPVYYR